MRTQIERVARQTRTIGAVSNGKAKRRVDRRTGEKYQSDHRVEKERNRTKRK